VEANVGGVFESIVLAVVGGVLKICDDPDDDPPLPEPPAKELASTP
jgi:hypothetical protein